MNIYIYLSFLKKLLFPKNENKFKIKEKQKEIQKEIQNQQYINSLIRKIPLEILKMISENKNMYDIYLLKEKLFKKHSKWEDILKKEELNEDFIEEFVEEFNSDDWYYVSQQKLSESFIEKYKHKVDWSEIIQFQKLNISFIEKNLNTIFSLPNGVLSVHCLALFQKLPIDFIENNIELFEDYFYLLSEHQKLPESFMEKYKEKIDWKIISRKQKLSESFIEKYKDKLDWESISFYQSLSESFIEKHQDKINLNSILWYSEKISRSFFEKCIEKFGDQLNLKELQFTFLHGLDEKVSIKSLIKFQDKFNISNLKIIDIFVTRYRNLIFLISAFLLFFLLFYFLKKRRTKRRFLFTIMFALLTSVILVSCIDIFRFYFRYYS